MGKGVLGEDLVLTHTIWVIAIKHGIDSGTASLQLGHLHLRILQFVEVMVPVGKERSLALCTMEHTDDGIHCRLYLGDDFYALLTYTEGQVGEVNPKVWTD